VHAKHKAALDDAIAEDHPCSDSFGCDIEVARANGFIEAAAHLLMGATETPAVNRVVFQYGLGIGGVHSPAFDKWCKFHRKYGRMCPSCESYMYDNPDTGERAHYCTNCRAAMNQGRAV
jgi:formamidopyrimidine-DNA glycosylase